MRDSLYRSLAHYMGKQVELSGYVQHLVETKGYAVVQLMVDDINYITFSVVDDVFHQNTNADVTIFDVLKIVSVEANEALSEAEKSSLVGERYGAMSFRRLDRYHSIETEIRSALRNFMSKDKQDTGISK